MTSNRTRLRILCGVSGALCGVVAGSMSQPPQTPAEHRMRNGSAAAPVSTNETDPQEKIRRAAAILTSQDAATIVAFDDSVLAWLRSGERDPARVAQLAGTLSDNARARFFAVVTAVDPPLAAATAAALDSREFSSGNYLRDALTAWAKRDVDAAMTFLADLPHTGRERYRRDILTSAAITDPDKAMEWASRTGGRFERQLKRGIIRELATVNPRRALDWCRENGTGGADIAKAVVDAARKQDPATLVACLAPDAPFTFAIEAADALKKEFTDLLILGREDRAKKILEMAGDPRSVEILHACYAYGQASANPEAALESLDSLPQSNLRDEVVWTAIRKLAEKDDARAAAAVENLRSSVDLTTGHGWTDFELARKALEFATRNRTPQ